MRKTAELEAKLRYFQADNENLVRERNNLDLQNVQLSRERAQLQENLTQAENELEFLRRAHDEHLDKFDLKFEQISLELSKIKNENI